MSRVVLQALRVWPVSLLACAVYLKEPKDVPVTVDNPTCTDTTTDGTETDIDCGGTTCPPCAAGKACLVDTDCDVDGGLGCTNGTCLQP